MNPIAKLWIIIGGVLGVTWLLALSYIWELKKKGGDSMDIIPVTVLVWTVTIVLVFVGVVTTVGKLLLK